MRTLVLIVTALSTLLPVSRLWAQDGNVSASESGGVLTLIGDSGNNHFQVELAPGESGLIGSDLIVRGGGTTINGTTGSPIFSGVTDIVINTRAGDDSVTLYGFRIEGSLDVDLEIGSDFLTLSEVTVAGRSFASAARGVDTISLLNSFFSDNVEVLSGRESDTIRVVGSTFRAPLLVTAGPGNDTLDSQDNLYDDVTIVTGGGADYLKLANDQLAALSIDTGRGADQIYLTSVDTSEASQIRARRGDDRVHASNCSFARLLTADGGEGNDTYDDTANSIAVSWLNFESP